MQVNKLITTALAITVLLSAAHAQTKTSMNQTFTMTLSKTFHSPLESLWKAWSDPNLIKQWWGPEGFTAPVAKVNFIESGVSLVCMKSPEGFEIYNTWTYTQIRPMYSIEFVQHFSDSTGNKLNPGSLGLPPGIPESVLHSIRFEDLRNGSTKLTVIETGYTNEQITEISKAGMQQVLDKLERLLARQNTSYVR